MQEKLPQLIMRHPDISKVPELVLPEGFTLKSHEAGDEKEWERIIENSFGYHFDFDFLIKAGDYAPEKVLYILKDNKFIATTTAVENAKYAGEGWGRMVGVHTDSRGLGVGKMISVAALNSLKERGYKTCVLSTDDQRIPAICLYLSVGFLPVYEHESHKERWEKIFEIIKDRKK